MGGLYNVLFGQDARAADLLAALGLRRADFYRYRDCYLAEFAGAQVIAVYTRGGGGNRECWPEVTLCSEEVHVAGCVVTLQEANRRHPLYLANEDDDFDSTYATFYFRLPAAAQLATAEASPRGSAAWERFFEALQAAGERR